MISIQDFFATEGHKGNFAINLGDASLHLHIVKREAPTLVVFFSAAVNRTVAITPPFFSGSGIGAKLSASYMCISDPCLELSSDLGLAWYAGADSLLLQHIIPDIIEKIARDFKVDSVILAGASGGGFASMYYASRIKNGQFFAVNPQTSILRYSRAHVERYARVCLGWDENSPLENCFSKIDYDLIPIYINSTSTGGIYLQNATDDHVVKHARPFIEGIGGSNCVVDQTVNKVHYFERLWGAGHAALPAEHWITILTHMIDHPVEDYSAVIDASLGAPGE